MFKTSQEYTLNLIGIGIGLIFLANSYIAFFAPAEFTDTVSRSFLANLPISVDLIVKFIGISDGLVGLLLISGMFRKYVSIYAVVWLIGVIVVSGIGNVASTVEHLGLLAFPSYLFLQTKKNA